MKTLILWYYRIFLELQGVDNPSLKGIVMSLADDIVSVLLLVCWS